MPKFTNRSLRTLKPDQKRYEVWESRGFGLRVFPSGAKSFVFMYKFGGKTRRMTLGDYAEMSLAEAHAEHAQARKLLKQGVDPGEQKRAAKRAEYEADTVAELADEYLRFYAKPRKRSWQEDERILQKDVLPRWGRRKVHTISRRDVVLLLDTVAERGAPTMRNRTLALCTKLFNFAVERGVLDASPCVHIRKDLESPRNRTLNEAEIRTFWTKLEEAAMQHPVLLALRLLLVTAQRRGEVANAEWSELDLDKGLWHIPKEKTKNGYAHTVPLSDLALETLAELKGHTGENRWLVPSPTGNKPITASALTRAINRNREIFGIDPFTPHDIRRSVRTQMSKLGHPRWGEKVLNHVPPKLERTYDTHDYLPQKKIALDAWARKLRQIIDGGEAKVIPLLRP